MRPAGHDSEVHLPKFLTEMALFCQFHNKHFWPKKTKMAEKFEIFQKCEISKKFILSPYCHGLAMKNPSFHCNPTTLDFSPKFIVPAVSSINVDFRSKLGVEILMRKTTFKGK